MAFHSKTLYPYNLNLNNFEIVDGGSGLFKVIKGNLIKSLNLKDGIEMIVNPINGKVENYLALVYSF